MNYELRTQFTIYNRKRLVAGSWRLVALLLSASLLLCSCQKWVSTQKGGIPNFPEKMVGVWQEEGEMPWKFIFAEKGAIKKVFRNDSLVMDIPAGGSTIGTPNDEVFANYVFGPCVWSYDPKTNILRVTVTIEDFYVKAGNAELDCCLIDKFDGPLSKDGKTWTATWTTITQWGGEFADQIDTDRTLILHKIK